MTSPPPPEHAAPRVAKDLVVAFAFPPFVDTAGVVAAKRVRERGRPVDVISNDMKRKRDIDPQLDVIAGPFVRRQTALPTATLFSSWKGLAEFTDEGLPVALAWDSAVSGYERVYSRAHWMPSHVLAARFKSEKPEVHWTAEFSDPLSVYVDARERIAAVEEGPLLDRMREDMRRAGFAPSCENLFRWVEELPYALADELVFTNTRQRDLMLGRIRDKALGVRARQRAVVLPHPTLPADFYQIADPDIPFRPDRVHIAYFGNFYRTRGMETVLTALRLAPPDVRERLQLHIFTGQGGEVEMALQRHRLEGLVDVRPFVGYLDFLALSTRMDVLLINDALTRGIFPANPFLPSKWSDYRGSGSKIWGLVEPGSALSEQPLDFRSPVEHVTAALQVLVRIARAG